jgi:ankyrin repeat protein
LYQASREGNLEVVRFLIDNQNFDCINQKDINGQTALHLGLFLNVKINNFLKILEIKATERGQIEVVGLLINKERFNCINFKDNYSRTALHLG